MHVNKKWKEHKEIVQECFEAPGMAKPKESQSPMDPYKLKMVLIFIIRINPSTSLQEKKMELLKNKFYPK